MSQDRYLDIGYELMLAHPGSRTIRGEVDGHPFWIKRSIPPKGRIWHSFQKIISLVITNPILRVTLSPGGGMALKMEANRLADFRAHGFKVPEILAINNDLIVMSDLGPQLREYLAKVPDPQARLDILKTSATAMARLHKSNMVHGRPYLRDMTWSEAEIGFLDLEEDPLLVMPLASAQARDVWIFLSAVSRFARRGEDKLVYDDPVIGEVFDEYLKHANADVVPELKRLVRFLRPANWIVRRFLWKHVGNDVRQSSVVTTYLAGRLTD